MREKILEEKNIEAKEIEDLIIKLKDYFDCKINQIKILSQADTRVEGWFKAEILFLLEDLINKGEIQSYQRELKINRQGHNRNNIDFEIILNNGKRILIELKSMVISQAGRTPRNLNFYFGNDEVGLYKDFRKLDVIEYNAQKYCIGFIYPKPTEQQWLKAINKIQNDLTGWHCITKLEDYCDEYFISVWTR